MAYCEHCGYEYAPGVTLCPDCNIPLTAGPSIFCPSCQERINEAMPYCPHCGILLHWGTPHQEICDTHPGVNAIGRCVICEKPLCETCAHRRQGRLFCRKDLEVKMAFDWVAVCATSTRYEANMVRDNLTSARIPAMILTQSDSMYVTTVGDLAVNEVLVPKQSLQDAQEVLTAMEQDRGTDAGKGTETPA